MAAAILGAPRRALQRSLAASCPPLRRPAGGHEVRVRHRGHHLLRRADRGRLLPAGHAGEAGESPGGRLGVRGCPLTAGLTAPQRGPPADTDWEGRGRQPCARLGATGSRWEPRCAS